MASPTLTSRYTCPRRTVMEPGSYASSIARALTSLKPGSWKQSTSKKPVARRASPDSSSLRMTPKRQHARGNEQNGGSSILRELCDDARSAGSQRRIADHLPRVHLLPLRLFLTLHLSLAHDLHFGSVLLVVRNFRSGGGFRSLLLLFLRRGLLRSFGLLLGLLLGRNLRLTFG